MVSGPSSRNAYGKWINEDGDVLKMDVISPQLVELNAIVSREFPCEDKYPDYKPHVTLAYLDPAVSSAYLNLPPPVRPDEVFKVETMEFTEASGDASHFIQVGRSILPTLGEKSLAGNKFRDLYDSVVRSPSPSHAEINSQVSVLAAGLSKAELIEAAEEVDVFASSGDSKQRIVDDVKRSIRNRKASNERTSYGKSYFSECERDEGGHCLPGGESGSGGKEKPKGSDEAKESEKVDPPKVKWHKERGVSSKVQVVSVDDVEGQHDEGHSKEASDKWAHLLAESIKKTGKVQALTAVSVGKGKFRIIDGKHRLQALRSLGVREIGIQMTGTEEREESRSKGLSWQAGGRGAELVAPPEFKGPRSVRRNKPALLGKAVRPSPFAGRKSLFAWQGKGQGTCKQGERSDLTGCAPASGETSHGEDGNENKPARTPRRLRKLKPVRVVPEGQTEAVEIPASVIAASRKWREAEARIEAGDKSKQTSISRPVVVMGDLPVRQEAYSDYLEKSGGREWEAAPLPEGIERGTPKECFRNASLLAMGGHGLDYVEGIAYSSKLPSDMGFLHAWCVTKDGTVVDPTWEEPEKCRYYGVRYDKKTYVRHIMKTKMYGVFGGNDKVARKIIERGGL